MTGERPDPLQRLDDTAAAVGGLRQVSHEEEPLEQVLGRVAAIAARAIPDADAVSVTVLSDGTAHSVARTDQRVVDVELSQYAANRGPCLDSARREHPVRAVMGENRERWPEFAHAAEQAGVNAYLAVPLLLDGDEQDKPAAGRLHVGALNIFSFSAHAFDPFDERLLRLFALAAAEAIRNARRWQRSRELVKNLEIALASRAEIEQAKGALMALHGYSADEAFAWLVKQSQHRHIKLRLVAREFIESVRRAARRAGSASK